MSETVWAGYRRQLLATIDADGVVERIIAEQDGAIVGSVLLFPPATNTYASAGLKVDCPEVRLLGARRTQQGSWRRAHG